jgi:hypothetical protein
LYPINEKIIVNCCLSAGKGKVNCPSVPEKVPLREAVVYTVTPEIATPAVSVIIPVMALFCDRMGEAASEKSKTRTRGSVILDLSGISHPFFSS